MCVGVRKSVTEVAYGEISCSTMKSNIVLDHIKNPIVTCCHFAKRLNQVELTISSLFVQASQFL